MVSLPNPASLPPFCIPTLLYDVTGLVNKFCDFAEHSFLNRVAYFLFNRMALMRNE